jgi:hypothetical protein
LCFLRNSSIDVIQLKTPAGFEGKDSAGSKYLVLPATEGAIHGPGIDLTGIKSIEFTGFGSGVGRAVHD